MSSDKLQEVGRGSVRQAEIFRDRATSQTCSEGEPGRGCESQCPLLAVKRTLTQLAEIAASYSKTPSRLSTNLSLVMPIDRTAL
jgi:hypothetical protein